MAQVVGIRDENNRPIKVRLGLMRHHTGHNADSGHAA